MYAVPRAVTWPTQHVGRDVTLADLTPRELDMITLITQGYSNQEIAETLYLGVNSVKTYIRGAYRKIGAVRRSHAIIWGFQQGLLEADAVPTTPSTPAA